ncbi:VOC family protein [Agrococcus baldri]|uniref:Glyoxalase n=1 Tax=Agrococcus baldri TaxID=153730 RepID=A0AA87UQZ3_9MICO|nr:VOC family protein [Agrococcus baldri]GEK78975.1 glyoxalase [Agrococcus baldri]
MLRGFANLNLVADDVPAAIEWYSKVLDQPPYFVRPETGAPEYAEFRFGDDEDELALMSSAYRPSLSEPGGAVMSMHVDDAAASLERLLELGATVQQPLMERGEGWWNATVADPFGNLLGIIQSPHWAAQHARG